MATNSSRLATAALISLGALLCATNAGAQTHVATVAGSDQWGSTDGPGAVARFYMPNGIAKDSLNNIYVADTFNYVIRKITPAGIVSLYSGVLSAPGFTTPKTFEGPVALAADTAGNIFVSSGDASLKRVDAMTGAVTTFVAPTAWPPGSTTGPNGHLNGLVLDAANNIYATDTDCSCIKKITPSGVVTVFAGVYGGGTAIDGSATTARFGTLKGIAIDAGGNLIVADFGNARIRKVSPTGVVTTVAGAAGPGFVDGPVATAKFEAVYGVTVRNNGSIYVSDAPGASSGSSGRLRVINSAGMVSTLFNTPRGAIDGPASTAQIDILTSLVAVGSTIYASDPRNNRVRRFTQPRIIGPGGGLSPPPPPPKG